VEDTVDIFDPNYYGMFTDAGNMQIANLVDRARTQGWNWSRTYQELCLLGEQKGTDEATDTEVREHVYHKLGFHNADESFWA
jgi:hypothetical protein